LRQGNNYLLFLSSRPLKGRPKILNEGRKDKKRRFKGKRIRKEEKEEEKKKVTW
jgi:hypothetical protein